MSVAQLNPLARQAGPADEITLRSGRRIRFRHIRPSDKASLADGLAHLSPESARRRFLTAKPKFSSAELSYLTEVDGASHAAIVAVPADAPDRVLGVGRYVRSHDDPATAEFAIVIVDQFQGQGLGKALAQLLAREAVGHGITQFTATTLAENAAVMRVMATISSRITLVGEDNGVNSYVADLDCASSLAA